MEKIADLPWLMKWQAPLSNISTLMQEREKKMVLFTTSRYYDPENQFFHFTKTCEVLKGVFEALVITKASGEERISWPHQDVHFSLKDGEKTIQSQGNHDVIQKILSSIYNGSMKPE